MITEIRRIDNSATLSLGAIIEDVSEKLYNKYKLNTNTKEKVMEITIEDITNKVKELLQDPENHLQRWFTLEFGYDRHGYYNPKGQDVTYKLEDLSIHEGLKNTPNIKVTVDGMNVGYYSKSILGVKELITMLKEHDDKRRKAFEDFQDYVLKAQKIEVKKYFGKEYSYDELDND